MSTNAVQELDPRVQPLNTKLKAAGVAVVAVAASGAVIVGGLSVIAAGVVTLVALGVVNFAVPVGARLICLQKQRALTALAEKFSEETVREDERQEGERIGILEQQYKNNRSQLEGAQQVLQDEMEGSDEGTKALIQSEIDRLQSVIDVAEEKLRQRKIDYEDLKKQNRLLIAFHRSAEALENSEEAERNPEELQRIETARNAIKTRMRAAVAGQTIQAMNAQIQRKPGMAETARLGVSQPVTVPVNLKEAERVPTRR